MNKKINIFPIQGKTRAATLPSFLSPFPHSFYLSFKLFCYYYSFFSFFLFVAGSRNAKGGKELVHAKGFN